MKDILEIEVEEDDIVVFPYKDYYNNPELVIALTTSITNYSASGKVMKSSSMSIDTSILYPEEVLVIRKAEVPPKSMFQGKAVVVTGTLPGFTRVTANTKIKDMGGIPHSEVTGPAKIDYLVAADDALRKNTSKVKDARRLGVMIIDQKQWAKLVRQWN